MSTVSAACAASVMSTRDTPNRSARYFARSGFCSTTTICSGRNNATPSWSTPFSNASPMLPPPMTASFPEVDTVLLESAEHEPGAERVARVEGEGGRAGPVRHAPDLGDDRGTAFGGGGFGHPAQERGVDDRVVPQELPGGKPSRLGEQGDARGSSRAAG